MYKKKKKKKKSVIAFCKAPNDKGVVLGVTEEEKQHYG